MTDEELKKKNAMLEERLEAAEKKLEDLGRVDEADYVAMTLDDLDKAVARQTARKHAVESMLKDALLALNKGRRL